VKKEILASLMSSCPWRQVSLLIVGAKMSSASRCLQHQESCVKMSSTSRKSHKDVRRQVGRVNMLRRFRYRYSFICQGTSTRRQRSDLFGLRVKLPPGTTSL